MNKTLNTKSIRQLLNRSSAQLDQPTLVQLRDARSQALARFDARSTATVFAWSGFNPGNSGQTTDSHYKLNNWGVVVLLAALLFSITTFMQHATEHDGSEVDIAILTDDLPIDIYVE